MTAGEVPHAAGAEQGPQKRSGVSTLTMPPYLTFSRGLSRRTVHHQLGQYLVFFLAYMAITGMPPAPLCRFSVSLVLLTHRHCPALWSMQSLRRKPPALLLRPTHTPCCANHRDDMDDNEEMVRNAKGDRPRAHGAAPARVLRTAVCKQHIAHVTGHFQ